MCKNQIDWFRVIVALGYSGYTQESIAASVGVARTTVQAWKSGCSPRWEDGEALLILFETVTGKSRDSVGASGYNPAHPS